MEKINFGKLSDIMREFNTNNPDKQDTACITGVIVFKQSNFKKPFSERDRSYRVSNANRQFQQGKISNQLSGDCLDGKDLGVRLDWYNWEVEYCYMEKT